MSKAVDTPSDISTSSESLNLESLTLEAAILSNGTSYSSRVSFKYSLLNEEAQEIRLLTLLPGAFDSEIRIYLENTPFATDNVPQFEALSYAWGADKNPADIFIGRSGHESLPVTQNLAQALVHLRYEDRTRVLWIDAICVNQKDVDERSSQVKRMADIYSKAARVVVWLGPESADTSIAMAYVEKVVSKVEVDWIAYEMRSLSDDVFRGNHLYESLVIL
jgi:hypothetical protein